MKLRILLLPPMALLLTGCFFSNYDRREAYLEAGSIQRVDIPSGLDRPPFEDALEIPEVVDVRNIAGQKFELGLPEPLSTSYGVDQIVIKKLGDTRWVFVDTPPATVWPKIRQFWEANRLDLEFVDPRRGTMESRWVVGRDGEAEEIFESLKASVSWVGMGPASRHKFRLRVEPGIRNGSTEIYIEHRSLPLEGPVRQGAVEWSGISDNPDLEGVVLTSLAYHLGETINARSSISRLATNIGGQKAELVPDRTKPVLKYRLPFNRAWVTVGDALENARISVEDLDRSAATYFVYYDETQRDSRGLFGRLFRDEDAVADSANRYLVHLDPREDEVHVTVLKDATTLADALVAERLLKIIKEYST